MTNGQTDGELLRRYLSDGDEEAFAALVRRHLSLVYGTALRRSNEPALAQEVTQNVFIALAKRAVWLVSHPSIGGWLYMTTLHLAQHELRGEQRRRRREEAACELGTCMKAEDPPLSNIGPLLDEVMQELRAGDREALVLRFFANKSLREVASALGVKEDAAQKRVAKALDALAERFRRRGFRVAGSVVLAAALQQATAQAVPAGLALTATQAALSAVASASLGSLTVPLIKIMSLTKIQTAAICLAVAALPLGYQWHALEHARAATAQISGQLRALRLEAFAREREQARFEAQVAAAQNQLSQPSAIAGTSGAGPARNEASFYVWDENSPYVRVPRQVLAQIRFAPFATRLGRDGKIEQYQLPPLRPDGTPEPALGAALGLSVEEAGQLRAICQTAFAEFYRLQSEHGQLTEEPFAGGKMASVKLKTAAFADEGAQFRDQFKGQIAALLGPERTEAFWQQAAPMFSELFNDFGAHARELQLIRNPNGLELFNAYHGGAAVGLLSQRNGMPLPPALQAYAESWAARNGQPAQTIEQPQNDR